MNETYGSLISTLQQFTPNCCTVHPCRLETAASHRRSRNTSGTRLAQVHSTSSCFRGGKNQSHRFNVGFGKVHGLNNFFQKYPNFGICFIPITGCSIVLHHFSTTCRTAGGEPSTDRQPAYFKRKSVALGTREVTP